MATRSSAGDFSLFLSSFVIYGGSKRLQPVYLHSFDNLGQFLNRDEQILSELQFLLIS
jgi:hypothetical protein